MAFSSSNVTILSPSVKYYTQAIHTNVFFYNLSSFNFPQTKATASVQLYPITETLDHTVIEMLDISLSVYME